MIRWCAYCQSYQGEVAPYGNYAITHGLCVPCEQSGRADDARAVELIRPIRAYYDELRAAARQGTLGDPWALVNRGLALGLEPADLAVGMLQPLLYEVGDRWSKRLLSVAQEHQVSGVVATMFELFYVQRPELARLRHVVEPDVLILCVDGNAHDIGVKLLQLQLVSRGLSTYVVTPGVPGPEGVALVRAIRPKVLGLSVQLDEHLGAAYALAAEVELLPAEVRPRVVVGGGAILRGAAIDPRSGLVPIRSAEELITLVAA